MIPYIGGKSNLAKRIISHFPEDYEKLSYVEVFGGGGWVMFRKERSYIEVYNDLNKHLVTLFRIIRDNYEEFKYKASVTNQSREMYAEAKERLKNETFLNEVEEALFFAIKQVQSFAGHGENYGYIVTPDKMSNGKWLPFLRRLDVINARLKTVNIECLDFEELIKKYDRPNTLFYVDPPYVDTEDYYDAEFNPGDHERLANLLKSIKGRFVLSYYSHPLIYDLYGDMVSESKQTVKSSRGTTVNNNTPRPKATELIIKNY